MQRLGTNISQTQAAQLTATQAAQLSALQHQRRVTAYPYYSTVCFVCFKQGDPESDGPWNYGMVAGSEARAFSYGIGKPMTNARASSFPIGGNPLIATPAETNLVTGSETISGENVEIHGLAVQTKQVGIANSSNDDDSRYLNPALLAHIQSNVSVDLSLNGDQNRFHLGTLGQLPGAGGLNGQAMDWTGIRPLGGESNQHSFANNGWPTRSNFFRMPEGLIWRQKGNADSQLNVIFRCERDFTIWSGGDIPNNNNAQGHDLIQDLLNGIQGFKYPDLIEVVLLVQLVGRVVGNRTRSA